ncbi:MAG: RNA polymerase sigma factor [Slackia sp.]|nr:RNA polymerase sigma factor [Slackia sp.]
MPSRGPILDVADVERIVEWHYDDVLAYCRRHAPVRDAAEDMAQEAFLRFVRSSKAYDERGKPLALLLTIARNVCADAARSLGRAPHLVELDEAAEPETHDAYPVELESVLAGLAPDEREAIELRFDQGLGVADAACVMGISRFAMNRLVKRALAQVSDALALESDGRLA